MPREARLKSESGIYHVMLRGINRQTIFQDDEDCAKFLQCVKESKELSRFTLYAYSLMGNHVHLLLREGDEPLEHIFRRIGARYVFWYNWKYRRSGPLFQDRYKSEAIEDETQLVAVLLYIYQNPVRSGLCACPWEYPWGSYRLLGTDSSLVDNDEIARLMPLEQLRVHINEPGEERFLEMAPEKRMSDREAALLRNKVCRIKSGTEFPELQQEKQERYLKNLHRRGCSIRQLVRITGISKGKIERMLK